MPSLHTLAPCTTDLGSPSSGRDTGGNCCNREEETRRGPILGVAAPPFCADVAAPAFCADVATATGLAMGRAMAPTGGVSEVLVTTSPISFIFFRGTLVSRDLPRRLPHTHKTAATLAATPTLTPTAISTT